MFSIVKKFFPLKENSKMAFLVILWSFGKANKKMAIDYRNELIAPKKHRKDEKRFSRILVVARRFVYTVI